jgi:hypothetical protein
LYRIILAAPVSFHYHGSAFVGKEEGQAGSEIENKPDHVRSVNKHEYE